MTQHVDGQNDGASAQARLDEIVRALEPKLAPTEAGLATYLQALGLDGARLRRYYGDTLIQELKVLGDGEVDIKMSSVEVFDMTTGLVTECPYLIADLWSPEENTDIRIYPWGVDISVYLGDEFASGQILFDPYLPFDVTGSFDLCKLHT